jgi:hypothetical protein
MDEYNDKLNIYKRDTLERKVESLKKQYDTIIRIYDDLNCKFKLCCSDYDLRKEIGVLKAKIKELFPVFAEGAIPADVNIEDVKANIRGIMSDIENISESEKEISEQRARLNINKDYHFREISSYEFVDVKKENVDNSESLKSVYAYYYNMNDQYSKYVGALRKELMLICPDINNLEFSSEIDIAGIEKNIKSIGNKIDEMYADAKKVIEYRNNQNSIIISELDGDEKR